MAVFFGNFGSNSGDSDWAQAAKGRRILKDNLNKDWYVYRVSSSSSIVKPYPVFDMAGMPCPVRVDDAGDTNPYALLPDAFACFKIAAYAGMDGTLEFVDFIADYNDYTTAVSDLKTPFWWLVTGLRSMLPGQNGAPPKDGKPTPAKLLQMQKNVSYSSDSIIFRGAVQVSNGKKSNSKNAVNGVLFKTFFYVPQKGARQNFLKLFTTRFDQRSPISADNCMLAGMFSPSNGCSIGFFKSGVDTSSAHDVVRVDPMTADNPLNQQNWATLMSEFQAAVGQAFNAYDDASYYAKLRESFGSFQNLNDCFNVMTAQQMVDMLLEYYPASWVWYGLKDSPYAPLVSDAKRAEAFNDPEMAARFGVAAPAAAPVMNSLVNNQPAMAQQPPVIQPRPQWAPPPASTPATPSLVNAAAPSAQLPRIPAAQPAVTMPVQQAPQYQEPDAIPMGGAPSAPVENDSLYNALASKYANK